MIISRLPSREINFVNSSIISFSPLSKTKETINTAAEDLDNFEIRTSSNLFSGILINLDVIY